MHDRVLHFGRIALHPLGARPGVHRSSLTSRIRQEAGRSSTAKLNKIISSAGPDGRVRGTKQYHGAGTGLIEWRQAVHGEGQGFIGRLGHGTCAFGGGR